MPGAVLPAKDKKHQHQARLQPVGMLHLPSGRVVACDAIATIDFMPLSRTVTPGVYPVEASVVTTTKDESRIAGVRIVFSSATVSTWEVASGGSGYPAEATSLGLFIDAQTVPALQSYIDDSDSEWWYEPPKTRGKDWQVACFTPDDERLETCALFDSTAGDGGFVSYWGLDAGGAAVVLVTDFGLIA